MESKEERQRIFLENSRVNKQNFEHHMKALKEAGLLIAEDIETAVEKVIENYVMDTAQEDCKRLIADSITNLLK